MSSVATLADAAAPPAIELPSLGSDDEAPLDLLRIDATNPDSLLSILEWLTGGDICSIACACKNLTEAAHADSLWLPLAEQLPSQWTYTARDRAIEAPWAYTLRIRSGLFSTSMWKQLDDHRKGLFPYLAEIGTVVDSTFRPDLSQLQAFGSHSLKCGAICELVQLEAAREGRVSHRTYKAVAEEIGALSADVKTAVPEDVHMVVRDIYKSCYPGFGSAIGAASAGVGFGESGSLAQIIARKGVARRVSRENVGVPDGVASISPAKRSSGRRVSRDNVGVPSAGGALSSPRGQAESPGVVRSRSADDEMRKRLESRHSFMSLVHH